MTPPRTRALVSSLGPLRPAAAWLCAVLSPCHTPDLARGAAICNHPEAPSFERHTSRHFATNWAPTGGFGHGGGPVVTRRYQGGRVWPPNNSAVRALERGPRAVGLAAVTSERAHPPTQPTTTVPHATMGTSQRPCAYLEVPIAGLVARILGRGDCLVGVTFRLGRQAVAHADVRVAQPVQVLVAWGGAEQPRRLVPE